MNSARDLNLDFCSPKAARYSVMRWHYSRAMPASKLVRIGVWEDGNFKGVVIFGVGANRHLSRPFGLEKTEACELTRVALAPGRRFPTSRVIAISIRLLKKQSPGLRLIVSYADLKEGHVGTVYQAGGWIYLGGATQPYLKVLGQVVHPRSVYDKYGKGGQSVDWLRKHVDPSAQRVPMPPKLKYAMPLDKAMREQLAPLAKPYVKKSCVGSIDSDALTAPGERGRCNSDPGAPISQTG